MIRLTMDMRYAASVATAVSSGCWRRETGTSEHSASSRSRFTRQPGCIRDTADNECGKGSTVHVIYLNLTSKRSAPLTGTYIVHTQIDAHLGSCFPRLAFRQRRRRSERRRCWRTPPRRSPAAAEQSAPGRTSARESRPKRIQLLRRHLKAEMMGNPMVILPKEPMIMKFS